MTIEAPISIQGESALPSCPEEWRARILRFEELLSQVPGVVVGDNDMMPLKHSFSTGMYVREIFIPAGSMLTGKIHRHDHPNFLMSGRVTVITEGQGIQHLEGPLAMISKAGTKRVVYAHTDVVWITVHLNPNEHRDIAKLEEEIIAKSYTELEGNATRLLAK